MDKKERENLITIFIIIGFLVVAFTYINQSEVCNYTYISGERIKVCIYK